MARYVRDCRHLRRGYGGWPSAYRKYSPDAAIRGVELSYALAQSEDFGPYVRTFPCSDLMKPAPFNYRAPTSLPEVLELLEAFGAEAQLLAGGLSLVPMMNFRLARPSVLIDLNNVDGLSDIKECAEGLEVGALTRYWQLEACELAYRTCPLLREAVGYIAHPVIRNRGTVGGSIANAHPSAELPAVLVALDGSVNLTGPRGKRRVAADEFFQFPFETDRAPDEVVTSLVFPYLAQGDGYSFKEFSRRHGDFAIAGVAAVVRRNAWRLALAGVGPKPLLVTAPDPGIASQSIDPGEDVHASADYRRELIRALAQEAISEARLRQADTPCRSPSKTRAT